MLGFDGVAALDLAGVLDTFYIAGGNDWRVRSTRYETVVVGLSTRPFRAESGLRFVPDTTLKDAPSFDTIVVPGGPGLREEKSNRTVAAWLRERSSTRRIVSVCTGLYGLAASGLLDGRRATTHWFHAADAARRFPKVTVAADAIFVKDGRFYTSAGMTAGIDLSLALVEEDFGPHLALSTARQLVVYMKRAGGQLQYSEPLKFQTRAGDRFAELVAAMLSDLSRDWKVEVMAAKVGLSSRQFARHFKTVFGTTPASYLEMLRLDEARTRIAGGERGLSRIAHATGFASDDVFRRAFERRFGVSPSHWRGRFVSTPTKETAHEMSSSL
ncbi:MAG: GlxA family transcriptional regulator [Alphaproteobacteria bacterium]|nr:GlxA family transcriptional regulator [Alphaproteobacteria bacterium]